MKTKSNKTKSNRAKVKPLKVGKQFQRTTRAALRRQARGEFKPIICCGGECDGKGCSEIPKNK